MIKTFNMIIISYKNDKTTCINNIFWNKDRKVFIDIISWIYNKTFSLDIISWNNETNVLQEPYFIE